MGKEDEYNKIEKEFGIPLAQKKVEGAAQIDDPIGYCVNNLLNFSACQQKTLPFTFFLQEELPLHLVNQARQGFLVLLVDKERQYRFITVPVSCSEWDARSYLGYNYPNVRAWAFLPSNVEFFDRTEQGMIYLEKDERATHDHTQFRFDYFNICQLSSEDTTLLLHTLVSLLKSDLRNSTSSVMSRLKSLGFSLRKEWLRKALSLISSPFTNSSNE